MEVVYDESKFVEMALYIARRLQDDCAGGATKLNTALFLAEFTHLRRHHRVISGCEFQKLAQGPTPRQLLPVRIRLIKSGEANLVKEDFLGRPHNRLVPTRFADLRVFSDDELKTIEDVLTQLAGMTDTQVSELSRQELGWRLALAGEAIPFSTAFLGVQQVQTPISKQLSKAVADRFGLETKE